MTNRSHAYFGKDFRPCEDHSPATNMGGAHGPMGPMGPWAPTILLPENDPRRGKNPGQNVHVIDISENICKIV